MTDTMRERMIDIVYQTAIIHIEPGVDPDVANAGTIVDAILSVLETPTEAVCEYMSDAHYGAPFSMDDICRSMVKAIRDGA